MENKFLLEEMDEKESLFWRYEKTENSLMISAWSDQKMCYHITTSVDNELLHYEKSGKQQRREKRFQKLEQKRREQENEEIDEDTHFAIPLERRKVIILEESSSELEDGVEDEVEDEDEIEEEKQHEERKNEREFTVPKVVTEYSKFMKGVDRFNQASAFYSFQRRTVRWYRSIVIWLLEVALNNAYRLYRQGLGDEALSTVKFRKEIIKEWEREHLAQRENNGVNEEENTAVRVEHEETGEMEEEQEEQEEQEETGEMEEEHRCRLELTDTDRDCDICSDRLNVRRRTNYICANPDCMVEPTRSDHELRYFRVHRECFHLHLNNH